MASLYDILTVNDKQYYRFLQDKEKSIVSKKDVPVKALEALTPQNIVDENGFVVVDNKVHEAQEPTEENLKELKVKLKAKDSKPETKEEDTSDQNSKDSKPETSPEVGPEDEEVEVQDDDDDEYDEDPTPKKVVSPQPERTAEDKRPVEPAFRSAVPQSRPGMGFPRVNGKTVDIFDGQTPHTHVKNVGGILVPLSEKNFRTKSESQIREQIAKFGKTPIDFAGLESQKAANEAVGVGGNAPLGGNVNVGGVVLDESEAVDSFSND